jgi:hypothetical protein
MAVYYYLAVACSDQEAAIAVSTHFDAVALSLYDGLAISCYASASQDWEKAWWSIVRPFGASINALGPDGQPEPNLANHAQRSEIGQLLYQRLLSAPQFLYALYGAEAQDQFFDVHSTYNRVLRDPTLIKNGWEGLVLNVALWEQIGSSASYETYRPGYVWMPYRREYNW